MVLIVAENLLKQLTAIHLAPVAVQQRHVVRVGAVRVRQKYFVRIIGDIVESLLCPCVVDLGGQTIFAFCTGKMRVQRVPPASVPYTG